MGKMNSYSTSDHIQITGINLDSDENFYLQIRKHLHDFGEIKRYDDNRFRKCIDVYYRSPDVARKVEQAFKERSEVCGQHLTCTLIDPVCDREKAQQRSAVDELVKGLMPQQRLNVLYAFKHFIRFYPDDAETVLRAYPAALLALRFLIGEDLEDSK